MGRLTTLKPRLGTLDTRRVAPAQIQTQGTQRTRGSAWMTIRDRILRRDNGTCKCSECAQAGRLRLAHEVDHVTPLWKGGKDDESNLSAINADCHKRKTAREAAERGR